MGRRVKNNFLIIGIILIVMVAFWGCKNPLLDIVKKVVEEFQEGEAIPEINLKQGEETISPGGAKDFGSVQEGNIGNTYIFTIENPGTAVLEISSISITGGDAAVFVLDTSGTILSVEPAGSTNFSVTFHPQTAGNKTAEVTIVNNVTAVNEGEYIFNLTGEATLIPAPQIDITQDGTTVAQDDTFDFPEQVITYYSDRVFDIENNGSVLLTLDGDPRVSISGDTSFWIEIQPPTGSIDPGQSTPFTIRFEPATTGIKTATISIANNDEDRNPYIFDVRGTAVTSGTVSDPEFDPVPGTYTSPRNVSISTTPSDATIVYTEDGSIPTRTNGDIYSSPIYVSSDITIRAFAYKDGYTDSGVSTGSYIITGTVATPTFSPGGGDYDGVDVTLTTSPSDAWIRYTTDGSTPTTTHGTRISSGTQISITETTYLRAIAYKTDWATSGIRNSNYYIVWAKSYGGSNTEYVGSIQQISGGGYILAGNSWSTNGALVMELGSNGDIVRRRNFSSSDHYGARSILEKSGGGYIVVGTSYYGGNDILVLDLNSTLGLLRDRTYGGSDTEWGNAIDQTLDGGYIVAGSTQSYGGNDDDAWVLKLTSTLGITWQKYFGGSAYDGLSSIQQTSDGGYVLAGYTRSYGGSDYDVWVLKIDSSGDIEWDYSYGGSNSDLAHSIQEIAGGGYIVAGSTASYGGSDYDVWVLKLYSGGAVHYQKAYGSSDEEGANSIQQTSDGGYIVLGYTDEYGAGERDLWVLKLYSTLDVEWQKTYGGTSYDCGHSIEQTEDGGYIVLGDTYSYGAGWEDFWVLKIEPNGDPVANIPAIGLILGQNTSATVTNTTAFNNPTSLVNGVNTSASWVNPTTSQTTPSVTVEEQYPE